MSNLLTIEESLTHFQTLIHSSIREGGNKAKTAMIRSSRPILNIHEAIKNQLISKGVNPEHIFPPLNARSPELKLAGALKQKDQDICVIPNHIEKQAEILQTELLNGTNDEYGTQFTEQTLVINVRSQISSIQKNFDTMYERTISEAQNLHDRCPNICLGEVYMIAVPEYDDKAFANQAIKFKATSQNMVEKYIKSFSAINQRTDLSKEFYKYEQVCLLIVDFSQSPPKLYNTDSELFEGGLLPADTDVSVEHLTFSNFIPSLLRIYEARFGTGRLS